MWFTRVSLQNPVFATMVMLALVVLGLFSYQRLQIDQFPNVDFPVVVVITEYPGAGPEIVESEVTKKVEEGVNAIAGINALTSRSYEGRSVVVIEFGLHIDGRKAADDVREKVAAVKPLLRTEVKEPRVLRFDPASRAIWSIALIPDSGAALGKAPVRTPSLRRNDQLGRADTEKATGERARRRFGQRGGRHQARDQPVPDPAGARGLWPDAGADRGGGAQRKPGSAGGHHSFARTGTGGSDRGAHRATRRLRQDHRRAAQWRAGAAGPTGAASSTARRNSTAWRCTTANARCC